MGPTAAVTVPGCVGSVDTGKPGPPHPDPPTHGPGAVAVEHHILHVLAQVSNSTQDGASSSPIRLQVRRHNQEVEPAQGQQDRTDSTAVIKLIQGSGQYI